MQSQKYRPLIPRQEAAPIDSTSSVNSEELGQDQGARRNRTNVACDNCRLRKRKCDGNTPACQNCVNAEVACIYSTRRGNVYYDELQLQLERSHAEISVLKCLLVSIGEATNRQAAFRCAEEIGSRDLSGTSMTPRELMRFFHDEFDALVVPSEGLSHALKNRLDQSTRNSYPTPQSSSLSATPYVSNSHVSNIDTPSDLQPAMAPMPGPPLHGSPMTAGAMEGMPRLPVNEAPSISVSNQFGFNESFRNMSFSAAIQANFHPNSIQHTQVQNLSLGNWMTLPLNFEDHSFYQLNISRAFSASIVAYRNKARLYIAQGSDRSDVFYTMINPALLRFSSETLYNHSIATWAICWVRQFDALRATSLPWRMALAHIAMKSMEWQIYPCSATYNALAPWMRPTTSQTFVPHFSLLDFVMWPSVREALLYYPIQHVEIVFKYIRFDWRTANNIFRSDVSSNTADMSPEFKSHANNIENWTIDPQILQELPDFLGVMESIKNPPADARE